MKDTLTGLLDWDAFRLLVEHELRVARRVKRYDALLVIDIVDLKSVNETYGRSEGDETLRAVGQLLTDTARDSDVVARIGDDEFAIFALDCEGDTLARRITAAVAKAAQSVGRGSGRVSQALGVGMSIGLTDVRPDEDFEPLMLRARNALHASKRGPRRQPAAAR